MDLVKRAYTVHNYDRTGISSQKLRERLRDYIMDSLQRMIQRNANERMGAVA